MLTKRPEDSLLHFVDGVKEDEDYQYPECISEYLDNVCLLGEHFGNLLLTSPKDDHNDGSAKDVEENGHPGELLC